MTALSGICSFCHENVLCSNKSWAYHHPSQSSLASSAYRGCTFCTLLYADTSEHQNDLKLKSPELTRWLTEDVAKVDLLPFGQGCSTSLYRWSVRSLGRARESKRTVAVTFRVVRRASKGRTEETVDADLCTYDLPERVFYCFPEADLGGLLSAAQLGTSTDPTVNGGLHIKQWIRTCASGHRQCPKRAGSASNFVPTRLLHIDGKRPGDQIRVINTNFNNIKGPYVTLSHCWGKVPLVALRAGTVEDFMLNSVPWCKLSLNFQQAIEVA
jgi:hypothetical protein